MFLTIVDDFTTPTLVFLIKHNNDFVAIFHMLLAHIEIQFKTQVLCICTEMLKSCLMATYCIIIMKKVYYIKGVVLILHNKMELWRESPDTF